MQSILTEEDFVGPDRDDVGYDDLETFDPRLFVDPFFVPSINNQPASGDALMKEAFDRYYVQDKRLRGMHSLIFIDEVALISTPESTQRGWQPSKAPVLSPPVTSRPLLTALLPNDSEFHDCSLPVVAEAPIAAPQIATKQNSPSSTSAEDYRIDALLEIQHAMLNLCQRDRTRFAS